MDYRKNYTNVLSLAERIRVGATQGKQTKAGGGLAARITPEPLPGEPDFQMVTANYMKDIQDMWKNTKPFLGEQASQAEIQNYLDAQDAKTSLENISAPSAKTEGHVDNGFFSKLVASESSGDPGAVHTTKDGRVYGGLIQIGEARLTDFNKATKSTVEMADILTSDSIQRDVINWHLGDLEKKAKVLARETGMDVTGLVAVGHLGGPTGMYKFAKSKGTYHKQDELGTSLMDYYTRFKNK
jgi:hypothetical protein